MHGRKSIKTRRTWISLRLLLLLIPLLLLVSHPSLLLAAPRIQQPPTDSADQVYGLVGLLKPATDEPANTQVYTTDAIHSVVGATPALDERLRWLAAQTPPAKVKVWGQWVGAATPTTAHQLVVTGLVVVNEAQTPATAWAVGEFDGVNVRTLPAPTAAAVGQIRQGEGYRIVGKDTDNQWWQICCIDGERAWIQQTLVAAEGVTTTVPVVTIPATTAVTTTVTAPASPVITPAGVPIVVTPVTPVTTGTLVPVLVTPTPVVTVSSGPLWQASYFTSTTLAGQPVVTELVTAVDFDWGSGAPAAQLPVDSFSARFEQTAPLVAGFYTLRAQADDGVRVYVNDELVIDEWHTGEPPVYEVGRQLSGLTTFRVDYYESGGQASLQFSYTLQNTFPDWRAEYYDNIGLTGTPAWVQPEALDTDVALSQQWSLASPVPDVLPENNWSARWTGSFPFVAGNYIFRVEANDGVQVWIDDIQVIDQWQDGSNQAETVFEDIGVGMHEITVEYYERGGIANIKVDWDRIVQPE